MDQPTLRLPRVILRPFDVADAAVVQRLAGDPAIADTTLNIPHPYLDGMAEQWIRSGAAAWAKRSGVAFAVTEDGELRGVITMKVDARSRCGELGYWIGQPFWGRGLATEAVRVILDFGFRELGLNRIQASHLSRNPSSGRVMEKAGMVREGVHRERFLKNDRFEDAVEYAILRRDWEVRDGA